MIILSNCLADVMDEGCLKVANSLIRRIKEKCPETTVVSCGESKKTGDIHIKTNKLLLNRKLLRLIRKKKEPVLYVPAVAKAHTMAARVMVLSLAARRGLQIVQVMQYKTGKLAAFLLKLSKVRVITLSHSSWEYYRGIVGDRAIYLKTGVDTTKFSPVDDRTKMSYREKYGLPQDKPIVLHVGHLRTGRNIDKMTLLDETVHGVLVTSTYEPQSREEELKTELQKRPNLTVLDGYLEHIEEIYQLSDVYLFPVVKEHNCIDIPLSAMEAAACNIPVVSTPYGEMKQLLGKDGFSEITSFDPEVLNRLIREAVGSHGAPRESALDYDWDFAVEKLLSSDINE